MLDTPHRPTEQDLEDILPIARIRTHCKLDDTPGQDDDLLKVYRSAAFEAATLYTRRTWVGQHVVVHPIATPINPESMFGRPIKVTLPSPVVDGIVTLTGLPQSMGGAQVIHIKPGSRKLRIPPMLVEMDCCTPCLQDNRGIFANYSTGVQRADDVPDGIILGCLKFIAFSIMNAGDEILTVRGNESGESTGIQGTNNAAWASGSIEQWRMYMARA